MDRKIVPARIQPPAERRQRFTLDINHGAPRYGAFRRTGHIKKDRHRQIAGLWQGLPPDAVAARPIGQNIDTRAHNRLHVQFISVQTCRNKHPSRAQCFELAFDMTDTTRRTRVFSKGRNCIPRFGKTVQNTHVFR